MDHTLPNILLVITDSQGWNMIGEAGSGLIRTPCIDSLAASGVSFTRSYSTCPLCTPARAGLFTGLYSHNAGAWANDLPVGSTIAHAGEWMQRAGYQTAYIGKWHLDGTDYFGTGICPDGWDPEYWYDGRNYLADLTEPERERWRAGLRTAEDIRSHGITREWTWAGHITDRACKFLRNARINDPLTRRAEPWFLVASYDEPHGPSVCPPPYCDMYTEYSYPRPENARDELQGKPSRHREWARSFTINPDGLRQPLYFGASSFVDDEIGRVVDAARETAADNLVVIFTTDHGHYLGAHGLDGKGPAMYEEVIRVPLIVTGPGIPRGIRSESLVSHLDILPTLLDIAGQEIPPILEGTSFVPTFRDPRKAVRDHLLAEFHRFSITHDSWFGFIPIRTIVGKEWKLTINLDDSDELYHLGDDPGELINRIDDPTCREIAGALHRQLLADMEISRDPFRGPRWADRPWSDVHPPAGIGGKRRPRPLDPRLPVPYNYDTGLPAARK